MNKVISDIIYKQLNAVELSTGEMNELQRWLDVSPANREVYNRLNNEKELKQRIGRRLAWQQSADKAFQDFSILHFKKEKTDEELQQIPPVHRIHFLKTAWVRYAAAVIIIIGVGTYLYLNNQKEKPSVTKTTSPVPVQNDVAPGGNKAILTLADGKTVVLDSLATGQIARQGSTRVQKSGDGLLVYEQGSAVGSTSAVLLNTLVTPRGGQYQLTLPDGSRVWLNAESSIMYPTAFTGKTREVSISGEAYFEVAKNKTKPFIVTAANQTIEVLGTHFNVNTYKDETTNNTTLLEGSVRIKTVHTSLTLKPGQQGQLNPRTNNLSLAVHPDVEQVMAWKEGRFYFAQEDIKTILRQFARWYDVEVIYEGQLKNRKFFGIVSRNSTLSEVLKLLEEGGIKFRIEGKKLYVQSD